MAKLLFLFSLSIPVFSSNASAGNQIGRMLKDKVSLTSNKIRNYLANHQQLRNSVVCATLAVSVCVGSLTHQQPAHGFWWQPFFAWATWKLLEHPPTKQQIYPSSVVYSEQTLVDNWQEDALAMTIDGSTMTFKEVLKHTEEKIQVVNKGLDNLMEGVMPYHPEYWSLFNDAKQAYDELQLIVKQAVDEDIISASVSIQISGQMLKAKSRLTNISIYKGSPIYGQNNFGWIGFDWDGAGYFDSPEEETYWGLFHSDVEKFNKAKELTAIDYSPGIMIHYVNNGISFVGRASPVNLMFPNLLLITDHVGGHPQKFIQVNQVSGVIIIASNQDLWGNIDFSTDNIDKLSINRSHSNFIQNPTSNYRGIIVATFSDEFRLVEVRRTKLEYEQEYRKLKEPITIILPPRTQGR